MKSFVSVISIIAVTLLIYLGFNGNVRQLTPTTPTAVAMLTPAPFPEVTVESWSNQITKVEGETVHIYFGDRAGGGGGDNDARTALWLLNYSLNSHPGSSIFILYYSYTVVMGTDEIEIVYNRRKKTFGTKSGGRGKPVTYNRPPMTGIDDEAIHAAAVGFGSYYDVKPLHRESSVR